jgi:Ca-activated chloride channel family protein
MTAVGRTLAATAAVAALGSAALARQLPSFRTGIDVVSLSVTVTDPSGRYVTDLTPEQFGVYEDGVKHDIAYFNRTSVPVALALLLDTSASMEDKMATAQEAAAGFARRLRPQDLGELIGFANRIEVMQGFTNDRTALEKAIRSTVAGGSTALYTAVYVSLKELKKIRAASEQEIRRQAIVVFTDGEDTSSLVGYDELLDLAKRSETVIYAIGLRSPAEAAGRTYSEADFALRQLAQETGGRSFFPSRIEDLAGVYGQIADELASQYVVGYISTSTKRDGAWRRVAVRVDREGATARTRLGYFAPTGKEAALGSRPSAVPALGTCVRW